MFYEEAREILVFLMPTDFFFYKAAKTELKQYSFLTLN